jgi:hypothetical protein
MGRGPCAFWRPGTFVMELFHHRPVVNMFFFDQKESSREREKASCAGIQLFKKATTVVCYG